MTNSRMKKTKQNPDADPKIVANHPQCSPHLHDNTETNHPPTYLPIAFNSTPLPLHHRSPSEACSPHLHNNQRTSSCCLQSLPLPLTSQIAIQGTFPSVSQPLCHKSPSNACPPQLHTPSWGEVIDNDVEFATRTYMCNVSRVSY